MGLLKLFPQFSMDQTGKEETITLRQIPRHVTGMYIVAKLQKETMFVRS